MTGPPYPGPTLESKGLRVCSLAIYIKYHKGKCLFSLQIFPEKIHNLIANFVRIKHLSEMRSAL
jgi:hypothetical protein